MPQAPKPEPRTQNPEQVVVGKQSENTQNTDQLQLRGIPFVRHTLRQ